MQDYLPNTNILLSHSSNSNRLYFKQLKTSLNSLMMVVNKTKKNFYDIKTKFLFEIVYHNNDSCVIHTVRNLFSFISVRQKRNKRRKIGGQGKFTSIINVEKQILQKYSWMKLSLSGRT